MLAKSVRADKNYWKKIIIWKHVEIRILRKRENNFKYYDKQAKSVRN